jgi:pyridoxamine 5'-phosphate oxidase
MRAQFLRSPGRHRAPIRALDEGSLAAHPLSQLRLWLEEAERVGPIAPAMTLATATKEAAPSTRIVLLRAIDERGLVFFSNRESRKGRELAENPRAALVFHWWELGRQVRVEGRVEQVAAAESEEYWRTRPRESRLAAWASPQSRSLGDRRALDDLYARAAERFAGEDVPLPPFWGGYRVLTEAVEFWAHRENRLHDRVLYTLAGGEWRRERLAP